jgi:hypothetical protein
MGVAILSAAAGVGAARILAMVPAWSRRREVDVEDEEEEEEEEEEDAPPPPPTTSLR